MLSKPFTQLFDRASTRLGLEIEIIDGALKSIYPPVQTDLYRSLTGTPNLRNALLQCLARNRVGHVFVAGEGYDVLPLPRGLGTNGGPALAVLRPRDAGLAPGPEFWTEAVRAIAEAEAASVAALADERDRSRRLLGTLRFLSHLTQTDSEAELAFALVQAAAVWFDADARLYEPDLSGDFVLAAALPGAAVEEPGRRLKLPPLSPTPELHRASSSVLWADGHARDVILVSLGASDRPAGVLALVGAKVADAAHLPVLGQVAGAQLELSRARRRERARAHFAELIRGRNEASPQAVAEILRDLVALAGARGAVLTLSRDGQSRTLAAIGAWSDAGPTPGEPGGGWRFDPNEFVCVFPLRRGVTATLEMHPLADETFTPISAMLTRVAAEVLHTWLAAAEASLVDSVRLPREPSLPPFLGRIDEELERAKRFDLRLSLVLVQLPQDLGVESEGVLQEALRCELRGSDVLGAIGGYGVAALLTHTDIRGVQKAVERIRRRLAERAGRLGIAGLNVGHAAFSPDCRTAATLVSAAAQVAVPVASM